MERIEQLLHTFNEVAPIAGTFGMSLSYNEQGQAVVDLPYNAGLDHATRRGRSSCCRASTWGKALSPNGEGARQFERGDLAPTRGVLVVERGQVAGWSRSAEIRAR